EAYHGFIQSVWRNRPQVKRTGRPIVSMEDPSTRWRFATLAIHSHQHPDPGTGAVVTPLYQTATFAQEEVGRNKGYDYTRAGNPTTAALEGCLAELEGGAHGLCFTTGLAALSTLTLALFKPGDHILCTEDVYGGTFRFFDRVMR